MLENNKEIKLSIIVPVYKVEQYIERCVRSLMEQTMKDNIEFIFINDCTPDNSMQILKQIINAYPNRKEQIRIIENEHNIGVSATRKLGVKIAQGEYIGWCDSDDWVEPTMYEELYQGTQNGKIDNVICNFIIEKETHKEEVIYNPCKTPKDCIINNWKGYYFPGSLWQQINRKQYIEKAINTIINVNYGEDIYTLFLVYYYSKSSAYTTKQLYHYNANNVSSLLHNTNYSYDSWLLQKQNIDKISKILYSNNGYKKYHVAINALKHSTKTHFKSAFKNIYQFYHTYSECYKDYNIYTFTPKAKRIKTYLVHNIYVLYWLFYRDYKNRDFFNYPPQYPQYYCNNTLDYTK